MVAVAKDYDQHLVKYGSETNLPKSDLEAKYSIATKTENHNYQFRAATVGYAHVWIVEFGKILDKTIKSDYVQSSFGKLEHSVSTEVVTGNQVVFELEKFEYKHYRAYKTMNIKVLDGDNEVLNKTYSSEGQSQGGQMWGASMCVVSQIKVVHSSKRSARAGEGLSAEKGFRPWGGV